MLFRINLIAAVLLTANAILSQQAYGQNATSEIDLERTGIIYSIGRVDRMIGRSAVIDLGDAHTLKVEEQVAVFRPTRNFYTPIGVIKIAETLPTSSQSIPTNVKVEAGDVVIFVREFSELQTADNHRDDYIKRQIIKNSGSNGYSTRDNNHTAETLLTYIRNQPKWEKGRLDVLGYLNGASFAEGGEKAIEPLLNQINQFRKHYRSGRNSLTAAGPKWMVVMQPLMSKTAKLQHAASQVGNADEEFENEPKGPSIRDITRSVNEQLFDRTDEERHLFSYMIATALEESPKDTDLWIRQQAELSQFSRLPAEEVVLEVISNLIRKLQDQ